MRRQFVAPAIGFQPPTKQGYVIPTFDSLQYTVLELDAEQADPGTTSVGTGSADSVLARGVEVTEDGARGGAAHVVLLEHAVAGQRCPALMCGETYLVLGGEVAAGDRIVVGDFSDVTGFRVRALVTEAGGTDGLLGLRRVYFDGDLGLGQVPGSDGSGDPVDPDPPGGGRPPGGFDTGLYDPDVAYPGSTVPSSFQFGQIAEF